MSIKEKWLGPASTYDKSIPYIYEARVDVLSGAGDEPVYESYFSDTICGLVEFLEGNDIRPSQVELFGVFRKEEVPLEVERCAGEDDRWLSREELCKSLEASYEQTHDKRYMGHVAGRRCRYADRTRKGY